MEQTARDQLQELLFGWTNQIRSYPGFEDWQRKRLSRTLFHGEFGLSATKDEDIHDFEFDTATLLKHDFVLRHLEVIKAVMAIGGVEFYFRRYPFTGLPISHSEHLTNVCEMFFSRIYQFREKLKESLNTFNKIEHGTIDVGKVVKIFDRVFRDELRERHAIHHRAVYEDIEIQQIGLMDLVSVHPDHRENWTEAKRIAYRRTTGLWVKRVQNRVRVAEELLEGVSAVLLPRAGFLRALK
jgi:hypothetical protein